MNVKGFFNAVLYGAAATLGSVMVMKGIEVSKDPYKKAQLKKSVIGIKDAIVKKTESA